MWERQRGTCKEISNYEWIVWIIRQRVLAKSSGNYKWEANGSSGQ